MLKNSEKSRTTIIYKKKTNIKEQIRKGTCISLWYILDESKPRPFAIAPLFIGISNKP
jgi:hypothetical protein